MKKNKKSTMAQHRAATEKSEAATELLDASAEAYRQAYEHLTSASTAIARADAEKESMLAVAPIARQIADAGKAFVAEASARAAAMMDAFVADVEARAASMSEACAQIESAMENRTAIVIAEPIIAAERERMRLVESERNALVDELQRLEWENRDLRDRNRDLAEKIEHGVPPAGIRRFVRRAIARGMSQIDANKLTSLVLRWVADIERRDAIFGTVVDLPDEAEPFNADAPEAQAAA